MHFFSGILKLYTLVLTKKFNILIWIILCVSTIQAFPILPKDNLLDPPKDVKADTLKKGSLLSKTDSISKIKQDSIQLANKNKKSGINTSVKYASEDSILFDAETSTMKLYGDSKIDYGDMSLKAEQIDINWLNNNVEARGVADSTGKLKGNPLFKEKEDQYQTKKIIYNFKTKKGIISEVITKQGDGYVHGEKVKKNERNELFVRHSNYTTCNLAHPHFSIASTKIKMIPEKRIISGPFNLVINDVQTPLGFLFGYFPVPKTRASGIIIPAYGEQQTRGFFLQGGGFYWALSDYIDMKFTGDFYTLGGAGFHQITNYKKRYAYNGNFMFDYDWFKNYNQLNLQEGIPNDQHRFWVKWTHSTVSKKPGRLTINVNAGSSNYNQLSTTLQNQSQTLAPAFNSSINYSRTFKNTPFSTNISLRQNQTNFGVKEFTLPEINVHMNRIMPFASVKGGKNADPIRKFYINYDFNAKNALTNDPNIIGMKTMLETTDSIGYYVPVKKMYTYADDFDKIVNAKNLNNGMQHVASAGTSLKLFKYFSVNPSFNTTEYWYFRKFDYAEDTASVLISKKGSKALDSSAVRQIIKKDTSTGFKRANQYNFSTSLTTRVYGTYFLRMGRLEAVRHVLIPTISYSYKPDFGRNEDYFRKLPNAPYGVYDGSTTLYNRLQGLPYGSPTAGQSSSIGFSLNNTLEMKIKNKSDTASAKNKFKKVILLESANIAGSHNLVADSLKWSTLSLTARTKLLGMFDINWIANIEPYVRENVSINDGRTLTSVRKDKLQFQNGKGLGNIENSSLNFGYSLGSQKFKKTKKEDLKTRADGKKGEGTDEEELKRIKSNPNEYLDFTIPWNMSLSYNLTYRQNHVPGMAPDNYLHSLTINGDISFTDKWKVQYSTGYSLTQKNITYTRFGITRDLHCWVMSLNWIPPIPGSAPSGQYNFQINVKSSVLQDLKLTRNRSWADVTQ